MMHCWISPLLWPELASIQKRAVCLGSRSPFLAESRPARNRTSMPNGPV